MEKNTAVLQITENNLRLIVGYVLDDKVYVLYALTNPIGPDIVSNGRIIDFPGLVNEVKKITQIKDSSAKLKISITEVVLCLPPIGLKVFSTRQVTSVVDPDESKVELIDVRNIHYLIQKEQLESDKIVDIIPEQFILGDNTVYDEAPIGRKSNTLSMQAKVHTLPKNVYEEYINAVQSSGIHVSRCVVSSFAACEALRDDEEIPSSYFLCDIGGKSSSVSFIGNKQLFGSTTIDWGGDDITEHIVKNFAINPADAKKYKELYGLSLRKLNFEPDVCTVEDEDHHQTTHKLNELNEIIKDELQIFADKYMLAVRLLLNQYSSEYAKFPLVIIGGGSLLPGLKEYILPKIANESIIIAAPKAIGARHPSFFTCLGALKASRKYHNIYDETHPKISSISRTKQ